MTPVQRYYHILDAYQRLDKAWDDAWTKLGTTSWDTSAVRWWQNNTRKKLYLKMRNNHRQSALGEEYKALWPYIFKYDSHWHDRVYYNHWTKNQFDANANIYIDHSAIKLALNKLYFKFIFAKDLSPSVSGYTEGLSKQ